MGGHCSKFEKVSFRGSPECRGRECRHKEIIIGKASAKTGKTKIFLVKSCMECGEKGNSAEKAERNQKNTKTGLRRSGGNMGGDKNLINFVQRTTKRPSVTGIKRRAV